jgi:glycerophosphoryl diester phosphodiesterase
MGKNNKRNETTDKEKREESGPIDST